MFKIVLMAAVIGTGMLLRLHEPPNGSIGLVKSVQAQPVPTPSIFALLGVGGLAMAAGLKRKR